MTVTKRQLAPFEIDCIARAAHEVNRAYALSLGDDSHAPWDTAPEDQKASSRAGVVNIAMWDNGPEQSHDAWMALKISQGWVRGDVKDAVAKTHPCLVPYAALSEEQRYKDELYVTVVKAMLNGLWRRPQ